MNESYQRSINQAAMLKKQLNNQKTSHQNTLEQLQTTYKIIQQMKQVLNRQQQKSKKLHKQLLNKQSKITSLSQQYEQQILQIKQLIDLKDTEIKKYTSIKVTDYDMIRLKVINEIQETHYEEVQQLKDQIKKLQFINNSKIYQQNVLRDKFSILDRECIELKDLNANIAEQFNTTHTKQLNRMHALLQKQKSQKQDLQKKLKAQKQYCKQSIQKYHKQLQKVNAEFLALQDNKQNTSKANNIQNAYPSTRAHEQTENQRLRKQSMLIQSQLKQLKFIHKQEINELKRKTSSLEKQTHSLTHELSLMKDEHQTKLHQIKQQKNEIIKRHQTKIIQLNEEHEKEMLKVKEEMVDKLNQQKRKRQFMQRSSYDSSTLIMQTLDNKISVQKYQKQISALEQQIKTLTRQNGRLKSLLEDGQSANKCTTPLHSIRNIEQKLRQASIQIVNLLKDKIALHSKIAQLSALKN